MMKRTIFFLITISFLACSTAKKATKLINSGNYDKAISTSVKKLRKNKTKKSSQPHILLLNDAFKKAVVKDKQRISYLELDGSPESYEEIFQLYVQLDNRQNKIKPLLPLHHNGRNVNFTIENYQEEIISSKRKLVNHLYTKSSKQLGQNISKVQIRKVYDDLSYVDKLQPNYNNVKSLLREAHDKGTDFIFVSIKNETNQIIPRRLENELLEFDTYGLDDFWTVYHSQKVNKVYDYRMELNFRNITISPERVRERDYIKEKEIKETTIVKDSLGKKRKVIKKKNVSCHLYEVHQEKTCNVVAKVNYINNKTGQLLEAFPLQSEFIFSHRYGTHKGDRRALDSVLSEMLGLREVSFPTNEQMVYDTGKDLKEKLKDIISRAKKL